MKIVLKKSIASLHRLTQAVQRANLRRTAGDPTWVWFINELFHFQYNCSFTHEGSTGTNLKMKIISG
jgi:hypothetical protein